MNDVNLCRFLSTQHSYISSQILVEKSSFSEAPSLVDLSDWSGEIKRSSWESEFVIVFVATYTASWGTNPHRSNPGISHILKILKLGMKLYYISDISAIQSFVFIYLKSQMAKRPQWIYK